VDEDVEVLSDVDEDVVCCAELDELEVVVPGADVLVCVVLVLLPAAVLEEEAGEVVEE